MVWSITRVTEFRGIDRPSFSHSMLTSTPLTPEGWRAPHLCLNPNQSCSRHQQAPSTSTLTRSTRDGVRSHRLRLTSHKTVPIGKADHKLQLVSLSCKSGFPATPSLDLTDLLDQLQNSGEATYTHWLLLEDRTKEADEHQMRRCPGQAMGEGAHSFHASLGTTSRCSATQKLSEPGSLGFDGVFIT